MKRVCLLLCVLGFGCGQPAQDGESGADGTPTNAPSAAPDDASNDEVPPPQSEPSVEPTQPVGADPALDAATNVEPDKTQPPTETTKNPDDTPPTADSLAARVQQLEVPPKWLADVTTTYDTSQPWKDARLHIRALLGKNEEPARKEAVKLTWLYLQKNDIGNGHEYPMYLFLGGEEVWAVAAHEQFLAKKHENEPIHAYLSLASLYTRFKEFGKAEKLLRRAMDGVPEGEWLFTRSADVHSAYGKLYVAWGKVDKAKDHFSRAADMYPASTHPWTQKDKQRKSADALAKLQVLEAGDFADAGLKDGTFKGTSLGYTGNINVTVTVQDGRLTNIDVQHTEKIDQGAAYIIPRWIVNAQSLQVDGISGATITKDAIVNATYRALKRAGLN